MNPKTLFDILTELDEYIGFLSDMAMSFNIHKEDIMRRNVLECSGLIRAKLDKIDNFVNNQK